MEWVRSQWAAAEAENIRLQGELDEALKTMAKWEGKFAHVRKLLDGEKRERNIILKKYNDLVRCFLTAVINRPIYLDLLYQRWDVSTILYYFKFLYHKARQVWMDRFISFGC